jgi:hypothetical protein
MRMAPLVLLSVLMAGQATGFVCHGPLAGWEIQLACALEEPAGPKPVAESKPSMLRPEPSALILLGAGLTAAGAYGAMKLRGREKK